jgi:hypothetical protein
LTDITLSCQQLNSGKAICKFRLTSFLLLAKKRYAEIESTQQNPITMGTGIKVREIPMMFKKNFINFATGIIIFIEYLEQVKLINY